MKYYIAGPMRGHKFFNFHLFDEAAAFLTARGDTYISPADIDRENGFNPHSLPEDYDWHNVPASINCTNEEAVERDIGAILKCEAIYMLSGWKDSIGATAEYHVAKWLDIPVEFQDPTEDPEYVPDVIEEAGRLASIDRQATYGHPSENWQRIVDAFAPLLKDKLKDGETFDVHDYWRLMVVTKLSRDVHRPKRDNKVDIVGYVQCAQQVYDKENADSNSK